MAAVTFVLVETVVSDGSGGAATGAVGTVVGPYSAALKTRLTDFWRDISGGRVDLIWSADVELTVSQTLAEWSLLDSRAKIDQVRAQARIPDGTEILLIANDAEAAKAATPRGSSPYLHASWASPAMVHTSWVTSSSGADPRKQGMRMSHGSSSATSTPIARASWAGTTTSCRSLTPRFLRSPRCRSRGGAAPP